MSTNSPPPWWAWFIIAIGVALLLRSIFSDWYVRTKEKRLIVEHENDVVSQGSFHRESPLAWVITILILFPAAYGAWMLQMQRPLSVSIQCHVEGVPVAEFSSISSSPLIDPIFSQFGLIDRWLVASARGFPPYFKQQYYGRLIYRCDLTNITHTHLRSVQLNGTLISTKSYGSASAGSVMCDGNDIRNTMSLTVPLGDIPDGQSHVFFFYNGTENCAAFHPVEASAPGVRLRMDMNYETKMLMSLTPAYSK